MFSVRCWMLDVNLGIRKTPNIEHRTGRLLVTELGDCLELGNWDLPRATFPTKPAEKLGSFVTISILSNG
jgi:hypothetical protein